MSHHCCWNATTNYYSICDDCVRSMLLFQVSISNCPISPELFMDPKDEDGEREKCGSIPSYSSVLDAFFNSYLISSGATGGFVSTIGTEMTTFVISGRATHSCFLFLHVRWTHDAAALQSVAALHCFFRWTSWLRCGWRSVPCVLNDCDGLYIWFP